MKMSDTMYHVVLRISALTLAVVLLFESGLLSPVTKELSLNAHSYVASTIGMSASVTPNELNTLTAELTARDTLLKEREAALAAREIEVGLKQSGDAVDYSTYILSTLLFVILVLIVLNYVLDYMRMRAVINQKLHEETV